MLCFAGDHALVIVDRGARAIDLAAGGERTLDVAADRVMGLAGFADQIWVAERDAAGGAALLRLGLDGQRLAAPLALPSAEGRWVASALSACAIWNGPDAATVSAAPLTTIAPLAERADLLVPYSPTRLAIVRGARVTFRTDGGARWTASALDPSVRIQDGAFLYDGSSLALVAAGRGGARTIVVLTTRDGVVQQRLSLAAAVSIHLAPRRGQALVQLDERRLVIVDLRFARTVGDYEHSEPIEAVAINASATGLVIATRDRTGALAVEQLAARELAPGATRVDDARTASPVVAVPPDAAAAEPGPEAAPAEPQPTPAPPVRFGVIDPPGLVPRSRALRAAPADARALLELERARIAALCYVATAHAWDQGRIAAAPGASLVRSCATWIASWSRTVRAGASSPEASGASRIVAPATSPSRPVADRLAPRSTATSPSVTPVVRSTVDRVASSSGVTRGG